MLIGGLLGMSRISGTSSGMVSMPMNPPQPVQLDSHSSIAPRVGPHGSTEPRPFPPLPLPPLPPLPLPPLILLLGFHEAHVNLLGDGYGWTPGYQDPQAAADGPLPA